MQEEFEFLQECFASETAKVETIPDIGTNKREVATFYIEESYPP